jgi:hypothetical protein
MTNLHLRVATISIAAIAAFALGTVHTAQAGPNLYNTTISIPCCGNAGTATPTGYVGPEPTTLPGPHGTGVGYVLGAGTPRVLSLPGGTLMASGTAITTASTGIVYSKDQFTIGNASGFFFAGGGLGSETFMASTFAAGPLMSSANNINGKPRRGNVTVTPGGDQFGGTMGLLGIDRFTLAITGVGLGLVTGTFPIGVQQVGIANRFTQFSKGYFTHTTLSFPTYISATVTGWKWTTGAVTVSDPLGFYNTLVVRSGTHNTNVHPVNGTTGTIQLVAPSFWQFSSPGGLFDDPEGGIFEFTIQFVPEPSSMIMLSAGLVALAGLYRIRKKL